MSDWNERQDAEVAEHENDALFKFLFVFVMTLVFFFLFAIFL